MLYSLKEDQVITVRYNKMADLGKQNARVVTIIHRLIQVALYP